MLYWAFWIISSHIVCFKARDLIQKFNKDFVEKNVLYTHKLYVGVTKLTTTTYIHATPIHILRFGALFNLAISLALTLILPHLPRSKNVKKKNCYIVLIYCQWPNHFHQELYHWQHYWELIYNLLKIIQPVSDYWLQVDDNWLVINDNFQTAGHNFIHVHEYCFFLVHS